MANSNSDKEAGEADVADVLRAAGRRIRPPDELMETVRSAVYAEWQLVVAERAAHLRRRLGAALAAGIALAALTVWVSQPLFRTSGEEMANASRVIGSVSSRSGSWGRRQPVSLHQPLHAGDELSTAQNGRAALALAGGVSLRLDHDTRVVLLDARHVAVESGAVYVDSGTAPQGAEQRLQIETPAGAVHHLGTQYEVRLLDTGVQIAVREGKVELSTREGPPQKAGAGEQLVVSTSGGVKRGIVSRYDPRWEWVAGTAPEFDINGRPLAEFLSWVARERGHDVVFATAESKAEANRVMLSGSVAGLPPSDALAAVLPTTRLRSVERDGQLIIVLDPAAQ